MCRPQSNMSGVLINEDTETQISMPEKYQYAITDL
jgi:hypothetical protein